MIVVCVVAGILLGIAAVITMYRMLAGPTSLDRLIAVDVLIAIAMSSLAIWAVATGDTTVATGDTTVVPAIVALALVGFLGSVAVTRFRVRDRE